MAPASKLDSATALAMADTTDGLETTPQLDVEQFLVDLADALNTTLDLDTLLDRVAELVRRVLPFEYFAILLLNDKAPLSNPPTPPTLTPLPLSLVPNSVTEPTTRYCAGMIAPG